MRNSYKKALDLINSSTHIVVISHINPDGDTIGSMLGLGTALRELGKNITFFNTEKELPKKFDFLPLFSKIKNQFPKRYDLTISVDSASQERIGITENIDISFDHHKSNTNFAKINIIDPSKVSTSLVVMDFLESCSLYISKDCAICLYTALVEDSGYFKYDRVSKETFLQASKLVELGAEPNYIANMLSNRNSLAKLRLIKTYIEKLELKNDAKVAVTKITQEDFIKTGAKISDADELVNMGLSLATVILSIYAYEMDSKNIKVSLRSKTDEIDCSKIAKKFGGGGHMKAAGFTANIKLIDGIIQYIINFIQKG